MSVTAELAAFLGADSLVMSAGAVVLALRLAPRTSVAAPPKPPPGNGSGTRASGSASGKGPAGAETDRAPLDALMAEEKAAANGGAAHERA